MNSSGKSSTFLIPVFCLFAGLFSAVAVWGRVSERRQDLGEKFSTFLKLTPERQAAVRRSYEDLRNQTETRRLQIEEIHNAVAADSQLQQTLDDYFAWWKVLPGDERDHFRELSSAEKLAFVQTHFSAGSQLRPDISIEFPGPRDSRFPRLNLTFEEYYHIIQSALKPLEKPSSLEEELTALETDRHRALRLTMWLFLEYFPTVRDVQMLRSTGDSFADALIAHVKDAEWNEKFRATFETTRTRRFGESWIRIMAFQIMDGSTLALGHSLQQEFPVTDQQIVDAFAEMENKSLQQELMTMPADEARIRLKLMVQSGGSDTAVQRLLGQYDRYSAQRARLMRLPFGFGDPSSFGEPPGPPPRQGDRGRPADRFDNRLPRNPSEGPPRR